MCVVGLNIRVGGQQCADVILERSYFCDKAVGFFLWVVALVLVGGVVGEYFLAGGVAHGHRGGSWV